MGFTSCKSPSAASNATVLFWRHCNSASVTVPLLLAALDISGVQWLQPTSLHSSCITVSLLLSLYCLLLAALDIPGVQRLLPAEWRARHTQFENIYKLEGVPVITVQLRYNGWITEMQDIERSRCVTIGGE